MAEKTAAKKSEIQHREDCPAKRTEKFQAVGRAGTTWNVVRCVDCGREVAVDSASGNEKED